MLADVTSIVKAKVDPRPKGRVNFFVREIYDNASIDGEVLVVVYRVPSMTTAQQRTAVLLFGGQKVSGDRFEIDLASPIDKTKPGNRIRMGLGISFGYQGTDQYSIIDVGGKRLTTSAGGQDDGDSLDGALITVGGFGNSPANPVSPTATPSDARTDDESYNLLPFVKHQSSKIVVETSNPSGDDNIFFSWFEISGEATVNQDTDGDGLLDSWETSGYDHNGDGIVDVPLHTMGANPLRKDIFVAYAWMQPGPTETLSHKPSLAVLSEVKRAFARAPVSNPDGSNGITLHFIDKGSVPHDDDLNPVWTEFDALMDPKVSPAERKVFHRYLAAHAYSNSSSSGLSRGIPASDFIESLGRWSTNPGTRIQRAGTIMHELGHNLGLRHGGPDHENYKPNHLSVMSYANQVVWLMRDGKPFLDYERFDLKNLNENSLNEADGLSIYGLSDAPLSKYGVRWFSGGVSKFKANSAHANVDWDGDGNSTETGVASNINNTNGNTALMARYPEWANIVYNGGDIGISSAKQKRNMASRPTDLQELTFEEYSLRQQFPLEMK